MPSLVLGVVSLSGTEGGLQGQKHFAPRPFTAPFVKGRWNPAEQLRQILRQVALSIRNSLGQTRPGLGYYDDPKNGSPSWGPMTLILL